MAYHVDVIETDWSGGVERLAARLIFNGKGVEIADSSDDSWSSKLLTPIADGFGEMVGPADDPKLFLHLLVDRLVDGTYVRAFAPHREFDCPFGAEREVSMRQEKAPGSGP